MMIVNPQMTLHTSLLQVSYRVYFVIILGKKL